MGRRGPPKKPHALRVLNGNPGKRPMTTTTPKPKGTVPRCPAWLSHEAKLVWRRLLPAIRDMGVLDAVDSEALATFCHVYARWREAEAFLDKNGMVYPLRDNKGNVKTMVQFPQVSIARNLLMIVRAFYQDFGMTPAARSRIEVPYKAPKPAPSTGTGVVDRLGNPC